MSIFHDIEQRTEQWHKLRLAIPTASQFERILTPKKLEVSSQSKDYLRELLAEYITGVPMTQMAVDGDQPEQYQSRWMERGQATEDQVWKAYEAYTEAETSRGGFFTTNDGLVGASPDRVVGTNGLLEAKAPALTTQIGYALDSATLQAEYKLQAQGQLFVSEREWCDLFAWHPKLFIPPLRIYRDETVIKVLRPVLESFVTTMLNARVLLEQRYGPFVRPEPRSDVPMDLLGVSEEDINAILEARDAAI